MDDTENLEEVRKACHRWLSIHDDEYRRKYLACVLYKHALKALISSCENQSTLLILKTITTPK
jgi:hypothetical protein